MLNDDIILQLKAQRELCRRVAEIDCGDAPRAEKMCDLLDTAINALKSLQVMNNEITTLYQ